MLVDRGQLLIHPKYDADLLHIVVNHANTQGDSYISSR